MSRIIFAFFVVSTVACSAQQEPQSPPHALSAPPHEGVELVFDSSSSRSGASEELAPLRLNPDRAASEGHLEMGPRSPGKSSW